MTPQKVNVPTLDAGTWNALIDKLAKRLPIRCVRTGKKWMHPWLISPEWSDEDGWLFRIKPGFVNGIDAETATLARLAGGHTLDRIEQETGKRPEKKQPVTAWLTEAPRIEFGATRIIGKGASPEEVVTTDDGAVSFKFEGVPEFFYQFGITPESVVFTGGLNSGIQLVEGDTTTPKDPPPILRAVDVVLSVDRLSAKLDIYRGNGMLDGFNALYFVRYGRAAPMKERPTLSITGKYVPKIEVDLGDFTQEITDEETDRIKIATIYLLSPKGTPMEAIPDGTWRPFVAHDVFWNLAHAPAILPDPIDYEPITIQTGLAGGFADAIFSAQLSALNDNLSIATALVGKPNLAGRFWSL